MANSTTNIDTVIQSQASKEVTINAALDASSQAMTYGRRASTCSGLTWGYYGGNVVRADGTMSQIANGTLTLTDSATNYIVAARATGVVSVSTATTNWNNTTDYWRLYTVTTGTATVTGYTDARDFVQRPGINALAGTLSLAKGGTGADLSAIAKGGIISGTGTGTVGATAVGTDGMVLAADSASSGGIKWVDIPGDGDMLLGTAQTVTAAKTFSDGTVKLAGATSGAITIKAPEVAGSGIVNLPASGDLVAIPATGKTTPVDADYAVIADTESSSVLRRLTWANIKATLKTYFDALYSAAGHNHTGTYEPADASILKDADLGVTVQAYDADIPTSAASQAEMEAGTEAGLRSMSPLRVKQAIAALAGSGGGGDMLLGTAQTVTAAKTYNDGTFKLAGATSGAITVKAPAAAGSGTVNLPASGDLVAIPADGKTTPVDADYTVIADTESSGVLKRLTWSNIKAALKTYFDSLYSATGHNHTGTYEPADASILKDADIGVTVQAYDADIPTSAASQAEMEAGTESGLRSMSPLRVKQAIAALAGSGGGDMLLGTAQTVTAAKTYNDGTFKLAGATSGAITVKAPAAAGSGTVNLPASGDLVVIPANGKTTPVDADYTVIADTESSGILKRLTWANIKSALKTYFDSLYSATGHNHSGTYEPADATILKDADIGVTVQAYDADIPTSAASQAEMEAGTEAGLRSMSPLRVKQAIAALAGSGGGGDMLLGTAQTVTAAKTYNDGTFKLAGATSGAITVKAPAAAGSGTVNLPASGDLVVIPANGKTTPVDADYTVIADTESSGILKRLTWANIKSALKTYFDSLYSATGHNHTGTYEPADASILKDADIGVTVQAYDADIPTSAASQAEMEAGTEAGLRAMSPLRVKQAIAALAGSGGGGTSLIYTPVSAATVSCVSGHLYSLDNASAATATLLASPADGDVIGFDAGNNRADNVIDPNGKTIMGLSGSMVLDFYPITLAYRAALNDWRLL